MTHSPARGDPFVLRNRRFHEKIRDASLYWLPERFGGSSTVAGAMQPALPAAGLCSEKDHKTHRVLWRVMLVRPTTAFDSFELLLSP
jgi:hypothetical protein